MVDDTRRGRNRFQRWVCLKNEEKPVIETMDVTALIKRPRHLEAIGTLTVEITHMERAMSELFGVIMGIPFFLGEAIYFTVNSGIARMDIVRNAADMVLCSLPDDLRFDRIRRLKQFFLGGFRRRERSLFLEFHLGCMIAMPMASVGRFSPLGPLGIIFFLFLCRPILSF